MSNAHSISVQPCRPQVPDAEFRLLVEIVDPYGIARAISSGRVEWVPMYTDERLREIAVDDNHLALLRRFGVRSSMAAPLVVRGRILGAIEMGSDKPNRLVVIYEDVTERMRFLRPAAHELRNPITTISTTLQLLQRTAPADVDAHKFKRRVDTLKAQTDNLVRHLDEMFDVVRLHASHLPIARDPLDLTELIARALQPFAAGATHALRFDAPPQPVIVVGDVERLRQAIHNLLHDAVKYTPHGETIRVVLTVDDHFARVEVRDPGVGIPKGEQGRIFAAFYRASNVANDEPAAWAPRLPCASRWPNDESPIGTSGGASQCLDKVGYVRASVPSAVM